MKTLSINPTQLYKCHHCGTFYSGSDHPKLTCLTILINRGKDLRKQLDDVLDSIMELGEA